MSRPRLCGRGLLASLLLAVGASTVLSASSASAPHAAPQWAEVCTAGGVRHMVLAAPGDAAATRP